MSELFLQVKKDSDALWTPLRPGIKTFEVPENEGIQLQFVGHNAHLLKDQDIECTGELQQIDAGRAHFIWRPFEHAGKVAYGWLHLRVSIPGSSQSTQDFFVCIVPSRLNREQWAHLFEDVRRVADALVNDWLSPENPHVGGLAQRSRKFSPATAMAQMEEEWKDFSASLGRITRSPRSEFRPSPPQTPQLDTEDLPNPIRSANIYENQMVALTTERLTATLNHIRRRAEATMRSANEIRERYKDVPVFSSRNANQPHPAVQEAQRLHENSQRMADTARERALFLQRTRRKLPGIPRDLASRGRVPHITPSIRQHPDYIRVARWHRAFGHQQLAFSSQELLSALGTRRASTLYEYWCILALVSALRELRYTPSFKQLSELVREDFVELELWRNRPFTFTRDGESLTFWYERPAHSHPKYLKVPKANAWKREIPGHAPDTPPGLYSRQGPREPDFWFELRRGNRLAVAVGDAIFSEGVDTIADKPAEDIRKKMGKVSEYAQDLVLIDSGKACFPSPHGVVVYCGHFESLDLIEEINSAGHILLPLRPLTTAPQDSPQSALPLDTRSIRTLDAFLRDLRASMESPKEDSE
ncbi:MULTISPECIES: nuclease domain-containing protein [unclassified Corallococcus]|uniref:nuclease domain-containing protein n=1 Tax=unclassified Corallococcus TaxID=2685029 RepID=UPI001A8CDD2B|nr:MULTISPECIES: nuclease domain-containing protein [unclassified Corallococcus]MBN9687793.1 hypothetical protein [Corallococcus sp. NCSPR001]WAS88393.1 nuclease domain-containing protein [Corallococcus sp. NCRR]